ncbi:crossover junction endodeoxyribonuclease RuvC [Alicyclobacillus hesperidum URH17-3-68]|uniref:crossover junction endodeoxyribonuclease RuvC n=1 Tax=Alicyclobacillus hesperidum TaxID=89784 RepID=UPI000281AD86|nr:crossover junction endodeoxyribonuclease RuvC [Alicyclobacillus hesperidum URH17-3-68]
MRVDAERIMGIDPGLARLGYGVIERAGGKLRQIVYGCVETPSHVPLPQRLQQIYQELTVLIDAYRPHVLAVEELFFNRNTTTAFTVGQARGVALLAGANADLAVFEYTPMQVKQAVTGFGRADKQQVQQMVKILLSLSAIPKPDDAADALAVAIAHAHTGPIARFGDAVRERKSTGWHWERRGGR